MSPKLTQTSRIHISFDDVENYLRGCIIHELRGWKQVSAELSSSLGFPRHPHETLIDEEHARLNWIIFVFVDRRDTFFKSTRADSANARSSNPSQAGRTKNFYSTGVINSHQTLSNIERLCVSVARMSEKTWKHQSAVVHTSSKRLKVVIMRLCAKFIPFRLSLEETF